MTNKQKLIDQYMKARARELQEQALDQEVHSVLPQVYAAFAIALYNRGWDADQIEELFVDTQDIWAESDAENMCRLCEELTGIDVQEKEDADGGY